jgi:CspA family cold shock protein
MAEGRIKFYREDKGYGFIEQENGEDLFFHRSSIESHGHFGLRKNDPVSFEITTTPRGLKAVKVKAKAL